MAESLGIITPGTFDATNSDAVFSIIGTDPVLEKFTDPSPDADYLVDSTNTTHTATAYFAMGDTPSNFGTMTTISAQLRFVKDVDGANKEWNGIQVQIFQSDRSTALTNPVWVAGDGNIGTDIVGTTATTGSVTALTGVNTSADKTVWDAAVVAITYDVNRLKGGTTDEYRVTAAELTGTYEIASGSTFLPRATFIM
jgi:hypothetical protein